MMMRENIEGGQKRPPRSYNGLRTRMLIAEN